jgi:hypothetical protein
MTPAFFRRNQRAPRDLSRIFHKPGDCHENRKDHYVWLALRPSPSSARRLWPNKRLRERLPKLTGSIAPSRFKTQSGTIGANTGGAAEEFKAQNGLSLDALHAGDRVTFSATETGGIKTITKLQKQ